MSALTSSPLVVGESVSYARVIAHTPRGGGESMGYGMYSVREYRELCGGWGKLTRNYA